MIQSHHLHTHGPEPLYTPVRADDVRPKIEVRKFDLNDETTWPDPERDGDGDCGHPHDAGAYRGLQDSMQEQAYKERPAATCKGLR